MAVRRRSGLKMRSSRQGDGAGSRESEQMVTPTPRRRPITTESIGSAATHPSLRGALATKQSRGHNMRGASNPDGRTAAPGLLRFARNDRQGIGSLVSPCRLSRARQEISQLGAYPSPLAGEGAPIGEICFPTNSFILRRFLSRITEKG